MKFVLRHLNLLQRPSSIEGHEWVEVHDPEIMIDVKVGLSCLLFLLVSAVMFALGDLYGSIFYVIMTMFSTLADAVYVNHYYLDLIDRFTAAIGVFYISWFSIQWFIFHHDWAQAVVWVKFFSQVVAGMTPFKFLEECRKHPVRSESWRDYHVKWHITGTLAMVFGVFVGQGHLDDLFLTVTNTELYTSAVSLVNFVPLLSLVE